PRRLRKQRPPNRAPPAGSPVLTASGKRYRQRSGRQRAPAAHPGDGKVAPHRRGQGTPARQGKAATSLSTNHRVLVGNRSELRALAPPGRAACEHSQRICHTLVQKMVPLMTAVSYLLQRQSRSALTLESATL